MTRKRVYSDEERRQRHNAACMKHYWANRQRINERNKRWINERNLADPDISRDAIKKWRALNPDKKREAGKRQQIAKRESTPRWLSSFQKNRIKLFYKLAKLKTKKTGTLYVVDHIVPLRGKFVRGLHVPWNLQVISMVENSRKSNKVG